MYRTWRRHLLRFLVMKRHLNKYLTPGEKYVTFDGLARACAKAGGFREPNLVHYNPKEFSFGKKKAFPFVTSIPLPLSRKQSEFDLVEGLTNSYQLNFGRGVFRKEADFTTDDMVLGKNLVVQS